MADKKISQLTAASTPLAGSEELPIVQSGETRRVTSDNLTVKNVRSNATTGILQVAGPTTGATRTMTVPDANFTAARTDSAQTFSGLQTFGGGVSVTSGKLTAAYGAGGDFIAVFQNTTSATPYNVWVKDAATPTAGYPLLQVTNSAGSGAYFRVDSSTGNTGIGDAPSSSASIRLKVTGDAEISSGNLIIGTAGKGIDFSATASGSGTMTSELLDDYEEGTWTPIYEPASGAFGAITYASVYGFYTKIGNVVFVSGQLITDAVTLGTAAGELFVGGLPFGAAQPSVLAVSWSQDFNTGNPSTMGVRGATLTNVRIFYRTSASGAAISIDVSFLQNAVGKNFIQFAGCYIAS
jgi:hypothetical protein